MFFQNFTFAGVANQTKFKMFGIPVKVGSKHLHINSKLRLNNKINAQVFI